MKIGFIGLGNMGLPMVKNNLRHNSDVLVYDTSESPVNEALRSGASVA